MSVLAVGVGRAANFNRGRGAGRSWRSSNANVVVIADLSIRTVGVCHASELDGSRGNWGRCTAGGCRDTDVVLTDMSVGTVSVDFTTQLDGRSR